MKKEYNVSYIDIPIDIRDTYQYYTKAAKHYFCSICGIHTHNRPRINPKIFGINIACIDDIDTFALKDVPVNNGENHPLDQKK